MRIISDILSYFNNIYNYLMEEETPQIRNERINNMPDREFKEYRIWCIENDLDYYKYRQSYFD